MELKVFVIFHPSPFSTSDTKSVSWRKLRSVYLLPSWFQLCFELTPPHFAHGPPASALLHPCLPVFLQPDCPPIWLFTEDQKQLVQTQPCPWTSPVLWFTIDVCIWLQDTPPSSLKAKLFFKTPWTVISTSFVALPHTTLHIIIWEHSLFLN